MMNNKTSQQITEMLTAWRAGDDRARDKLLESIYPQLRAIAHNRKRAGGDEALSTTEIVHETFIRLVGQQWAHYENRDHFFRIAARHARRVLVDQHRHQQRAKRGGGEPHISLDAVDVAATVEDDAHVIQIAVEESMHQLAEVDARAAQVATLRFLAGLNHDETATVLGCSRATVTRSWRFARAFLKANLIGEDKGVDEDNTPPLLES